MNSRSRAVDWPRILLDACRGLGPAERLRFDHVIGRLQNIREFVGVRFDNPGVGEFREQFKQLYDAPTQELIVNNTTRMLASEASRPKADDE